MTLPVVDNAHVAEGLALFTSRYAKQPNVTGIATSLLQQLQDVETSLWSIISGVQLVNHPMAGGPWDILDKIGAIVGEPRNGRVDTDYLLAIKIRIRVNRSRGLANDLISIVGLIVSGAQYFEWLPAAFEFTVFDTTANILAALTAVLGQARSAGTAGAIRYSVDAGPLLVLNSVHGGVTAATHGWGSVHGGVTGGELSGIAPF